MIRPSGAEGASMTEYNKDTAARLVRSWREHRDDLARHGGSWLGAARSWIKRHCLNGERVTWGSRDVLQHEFTVDDVERIALEVASAAFDESAALAEHLDAAGAEVERLTEALDRARELSGIKQWADDVRLACKFAAERDRLAVEAEQLRQNGPAWLRFALQCLHAQVDRTDPDDPVGAALTRAGLERLGADCGPEHAAHLARLSLTPEEVEALRFARDTVSAGTHGAAFGLWTSAYQDRYFSALAVLDRLLAAAQERKP